MGIQGRQGRLAPTEAPLRRLSMPIIDDPNVSTFTLGMPGCTSQVGTATWASAADYLRHVPFTVTKPITITEAHAHVAVAGVASTVCRLSIYEATRGGRLLNVLGTFLTDSTGAKSIVGLAVLLDVGHYFATWQLSGGPTLTFQRRVNPWWQGLYSAHNGGTVNGCFTSGNPSYASGPPATVSVAPTTGGLDGAGWYHPMSFRWVHT